MPFGLVVSSNITEIGAICTVNHKEVVVDELHQLLFQS